MLPVQTIICPTDFSKAAYGGLTSAVELAEHFGSKLVLLHVVAPMPVIVGAGSPSGFHLPSVIQEMEDQAAMMLERIRAEKVPDAIRSSCRVIVGKPADDIVKTAEDENSALIVIASHGESGWQRFLSGSITEKVVRMASCPVLVVPAPDADAGENG